MQARAVNPYLRNYELLINIRFCRTLNEGFPPQADPCSGFRIE
ncbi:hypothetical protein D1BOALGB6SA_7750 [Olavius sp. associated proteobacterium Delta 1]|nr:hypothetical protein D1BOALGB6SA_7750 [Olavius sp. associated proteobacterium Delta 1]